MRPRIPITRKPTRIIHLGLLRPTPVLTYEIPLIELIIRKGMSKIAKQRVKTLHSSTGIYEYQPSTSYFHYASKMAPLGKQKIS